MSTDDLLELDARLTRALADTEALRAWLASKPADEQVAISSCRGHCPIAQMLLDTLPEATFVGVGGASARLLINPTISREEGYLAAIATVDQWAAEEHEKYPWLQEVADWQAVDARFEETVRVTPGTTQLQATLPDWAQEFVDTIDRIARTGKPLLVKGHFDGPHYGNPVSAALALRALDAVCAGTASELADDDEEEKYDEDE